MSREEVCAAIVESVLPDDLRLLWQLVGDDISLLEQPMLTGFWDEMTSEQINQVTLGEQLGFQLFCWVKQALTEYIEWQRQQLVPLTPPARALFQAMRKAYVCHGLHGSLWILRIQVELGQPFTLASEDQARAVLGELERARLAVRRTCDDEQYWLALSQRVQLVRKYHLDQAWGKNDRDEEALARAHSFSVSKL